MIFYRFFVPLLLYTFYIGSLKEVGRLYIKLEAQLKAEVDDLMEFTSQADTIKSSETDRLLAVILFENYLNFSRIHRQEFNGFR